MLYQDIGNEILLAFSGTIPPNFLWTVFEEKVTLDNNLLALKITTEVSSQLVSIPKQTNFSLL